MASPWLELERDLLVSGHYRYLRQILAAARAGLLPRSALGRVWAGRRVIAELRAFDLDNHSGIWMWPAALREQYMFTTVVRAKPPTRAEVVKHLLSLYPLPEDRAWRGLRQRLGR